jgi:hypothetical protein
MSILGPAESDGFEAASLAAIDAATRSDWRAAAWRLQHSPATRERYSSYDHGRELTLKVLDRVMKAWDHLQMPNDLKMRFLLALQAEGLPLDDEAEQ